MANTAFTMRISPNGQLTNTAPVNSAYNLAPTPLPKGNVGSINSKGQLQPNKNPVVSSNSGATAPKPTPITTPALQTPAAQNYMQSLGGTPAPAVGSGLVSGNFANSSPVTNTPVSNEPPQPSAADLAFAEYIKALAPSQDLTKAQTDYNDFVASAELGIKNKEGQGRGIPLQLVRGQQAKLADQAEIEAKRLQGNVNIAQNSYTQSQNAAKAKLDYLSAKEKPTEVGGALVKLNPATGKYETIYQAPVKPEAQPASVQEYEYAKSQGYKGTFTDYQNDDANRKAQVLSPANISSTVNSIAQAFDNEPIVKEYNTVAQQVDALKKAGSSPTDDIQRIYAFAKIMDPNSVVREGEYKTVQDYSTALLQRMGIKLNRVFNNDGFLTDDARTKMMTTLNNVLASKKQAYDNLYKSYNSRIDQAKQGGFNSLPNYGTAFDSGQGGAGSPDDLINKYLPGFKPVGNTSASKPAVDKVMAAIGQYESGGRYNAIGKTTASGDKAYGKYQVMGANIPQWTKEALGKSLTPQEFLDDPKAQDAVANYKMGKLVAQGYGLDDVASIWFSGRPAAKAGNAKDVNNTSVPKYIANIRAIYSKLG